MAKIEDLATSITQLSPTARFKLISDIRRRRRIRPPVKAKKPAKVKRKANKKNLRPQDAFGHINNMTEEQKIRLAAKLLGLDK
jgi:hypothetical protein